MRLLVENFEVFEALSSLRPFEWWIAWGGGGKRRVAPSQNGVAPSHMPLRHAPDPSAFGVKSLMRKAAPA